MSFKKIPSDSLIRAGFWFLLAYFIFNVLNFLYHFFSARMLGPSEYGIVAALFSIVYLVGIISSSIQTTITKFSADLNARKQYGKLSFLFNRASKKIFFYSSIIFLVYLLFLPLISSFLSIPIIPSFLLGFLFVFSAIISVNRGMLQGLQKFKVLGLNMVLEGFLKLIFAIILIFFGFKASGAIAALSLAGGIALAHSFLPLKLSKKKKNFVTKEIYYYSWPVLIALLSITTFYTFDLFLVKHFFSAEQAGHYSVLSLLGKIIFFGATSVGMIMFPKVTEAHAKNREHKGILIKSLILSLTISLTFLIIYFLFSSHIVGLIFGAAYSDISPLVGLFGIFMTLLSLCYMVVLYKLSIGKKKFIWVLVLFAVAEIILISLFHNSLTQIVNILIVLAAILFLVLLK